LLQHGRTHAFRRPSTPSHPPAAHNALDFLDGKAA
jgi:hypothetical protein